MPWWGWLLVGIATGGLVMLGIAAWWLLESLKNWW